VGQTGHQHPLEVRHDGVERLRFLWCPGRQRRGDLARLDAGEHRIPFRMLEVLGDPVDQFVAVPAKCRRVHRQTP
jgi:hypothetical protein